MAKIDRLLVGEALVGDGNEVAHIDLIIGPRGSPAETAFAMTLTNQKEGVNGLLAVLEPNLMVKPATVLFNKVTIKDAKQAVQMFGPAQRAVAMAVADCVAEGSPFTGSETSVSVPNTTTRSPATRRSCEVAMSAPPPPMGAGVTSTRERTARLPASVMRRFPSPSRS